MKWNLSGRVDHGVGVFVHRRVAGQLLRPVDIGLSARYRTRFGPWSTGGGFWAWDGRVELCSVRNAKDFEARVLVFLFACASHSLLALDSFL
jgi:hypothetical protein